MSVLWLVTFHALNCFTVSQLAFCFAVGLTLTCPHLGWWHRLTIYLICFITLKWTHECHSNKWAVGWNITLYKPRLVMMANQRIHDPFWQYYEEHRICWYVCNVCSKAPTLDGDTRCDLHFVLIISYQASISIIHAKLNRLFYFFHIRVRQ